MGSNLSQIQIENPGQTSPAETVQHEDKHSYTLPVPHLRINSDNEESKAEGEAKRSDATGAEFDDPLTNSFLTNGDLSEDRNRDLAETSGKEAAIMSRRPQVLKITDSATTSSPPRCCTVDKRVSVPICVLTVQVKKPPSCLDAPRC